MTVRCQRYVSNVPNR